MKTVGFALSIVLALATTSAGRPGSGGGITSAEYDVYTACLRRGATDRELRNTEFVVIADLTFGADSVSEPTAMPGDPTDELREQYPAAPGDLAVEFNRVNKIGGTVESGSFDGITVKTLSLDDLSRMFSASVGDGWAEFHKRYPKSSGTWSFSHVAFDRSGSWAVLYTGFSCGGLCGEGNYVVLKRSPDGWREARKIGLWVS